MECSRFCSKDANKVISSINNIDNLDYYKLEQTLSRCYPAGFIYLYNIKKNFDAVCSMILNGYYRNIKLKVNIDWSNEKIIDYYNILTNYFLDDYFNYNDFDCFTDLIKYDIKLLLEVGKSVRVKNFRYLKTVIMGNYGESKDINYKEIEIDDTKGDIKYDTDSLKNMV